MSRFYASGRNVYCGDALVQEMGSRKYAKQLAEHLNEIHSKEDDKRRRNNIVKQGNINESKFKKYKKKPVVVKAYQTTEEVLIHTLEGTMKADEGDFIIIGVHGEPYPCKPDIFYETYEEVIE